MNKQFFYTRKVTSKNKEGVEETKVYTDSINLDKVTRSVELEDGRLIILLDDIHQRVEAEPVFSKNGKKDRPSGFKNVTKTYQTEVYLEGEDITRFRAAFA